MSGGRVVIAGGTGFVGQHLTPVLRRAGFEVTILGRGKTAERNGIRHVQWDGETVGPWADGLDGAVAIVNLAGKSINCHHTDKNRREILKSRVNSVRALGHALAFIPKPPTVWIQASGIGVYGDTGDHVCTEEAPHGLDFTAQVCDEWEGALAAVRTPIRKVVLRLGLVMHPNGGFLKILARLTRLFLGGQAGDGRQYVSWIHMADLCHMFLVSLRYAEIFGTYNACSPYPVTNAELMAELRHALHRPWSPPVPKFAARIGSWLMGSEPSLVFASQRGVPRHFLAQDFPFDFPQLRPALENLFQKRKP